MRPLSIGVLPARLRRGSRAGLGGSVVAATALSVASVASVAAGVGESGESGEEALGAAVASEAAVRGTAVATRPVPPEPGCERVVVEGDSLTVGARSALEHGLAGAGFDAVVDAYSGRSISRSMTPPYSGVIAAEAVRATFGEADCWVIALGSNDLYAGGDDPAVAAALVDEMLEVVTPGADVWWVNINFHDNPNDFGLGVDEVQGTADFNAVLDARAQGDPALTVIDWYSYSEAHLWWFLDAVHVNSAGYQARAQQIVDALPR